MSTEVAVLVGLLCGSWLTIMVEVILAALVAMRQSRAKTRPQAIRVDTTLIEKK